MVPQNQLAALNRSTSVPMPANLEDFDKNPESYPASGRQLDVALVTLTGVSKGARFISRFVSITWTAQRVSECTRLVRFRLQFDLRSQNREKFRHPGRMCRPCGSSNQIGIHDSLIHRDLDECSTGHRHVR